MKPKKEPQIPFDGMKPGDDVYIEGKSRSIIVQAFSQYLAKGKYSIRKEGDGFRFYLLNKGE